MMLGRNINIEEEKARKESVMKTHLKQEGAQTYFVVSDLNAIEVSGVQELGFLPYADGWARAYPSTTPHLEVFYHHFARCAQEMILQRAGTRLVPWQRA
jgi:D-hexose-6-phosphate mutarotase